MLQVYRETERKHTAKEGNLSRFASDRNLPSQLAGTCLHCTKLKLNTVTVCWHVVDNAASEVDLQQSNRR